MELYALPATVFTVGLVFARLGTMLMLLPGFGETTVPPRLRLALALILSISIGGLVADKIPAVPAQPLAMAGLVGGEVLVGLMFGSIGRLMMSALAVAGQMAGMQTGLAFAQTFDPSQGKQGAILATFLNLSAVTLIFVTGLHHVFIAGLLGSYDLIPPGHLPNPADPAMWAVDTVANSFRLGIQMASPLIAFGLVFYLALGVLSRLMPQVQIFFVAMPSNILAGLAIFALSFGSMLGVWLRYIGQYGTMLNVR